MATPGVSTRPGGVVRFAAPVDLDYAVTGLNYAPAATVAGFFAPAASSATLSLTPVSTPLVRTLSLTGGSVLMFTGGRVNFSPATGSVGGSYTVARGVGRSFTGVVLQGGGINKVRGFLLKPGESSPVQIQP